MGGKGELSFPSGEKFIEEMRNNLPNGGEVKYFANGDKFTGDFKNGFSGASGHFLSIQAEADHGCIQLGEFLAGDCVHLVPLN